MPHRASRAHALAACSLLGRVIAHASTNGEMVGSMCALPGVVLACLPGRCAVCAAALGLRAQFCEDHAKPHCTAVAHLASDVAMRATRGAPPFCFKSANAAIARITYKMRSSSWLKSLIGLVFDGARKPSAPPRARGLAAAVGGEKRRNDSVVLRAARGVLRRILSSDLARPRWTRSRPPRRFKRTDRIREATRRTPSDGARRRDAFV